MISLTRKSCTEVERTFDYRLVKRLAPWPPVISRKVIYLVEPNKGLWAFHEHLDGLISHIEMAPDCRGKEAIELSKQALEWVFDNLSVDTIYAGIPKSNKPACHNAKHIGYKFTHEDADKRYYEFNRNQIMKSPELLTGINMNIAGG